MDAARKKYEVKKKSIEQVMETAFRELEKEDPSRAVLQKHIPALERCQERFLAVGEGFLDAKHRNDDDTDSIAALELEMNDIFSDSELILVKIKDSFKVQAQPEEDSQHQGGQKLHRLPKLELPKFGGEARDWLQFWSAFKSIHEDDNITDTVKFQYLTTCMVKDSSAQELVSSFPISAANYPNVVTCLEERFGREDMLVEVYVRDIITLIMENAQSKTTSSFSSLYVKLSSQLRALGSLGVTSDKCAAILYPMVESTLPEDVFVAWERHRHQNPVEAAKKSEDHLGRLMEFLKHEVEGSERIRMARQPFSTKGGDSKKHLNKPQPVTAASLIVTDNVIPGCVFCDGKHDSDKCCRAVSMSLEDRRKIIFEKRHCFSCLKPGHTSKKCKQRVKCPSCGKRHFAILCPDIVCKPEKKSEEHKKTTLSSSVEMCNQVQVDSVLFQTVLVKIKGKNKTKIVRALFDCGSQNSYILKSTVAEVGLQKIGTTESIHLLFGGMQTTPQVHSRYKIHLSDLQSSYCCNFDVQDSNSICGHIPDIPTGNWLSELKERGILLTDIGHHSSQIELLLGVDVYGNFLTGELLKLDCGPVAIETKFGWTVCGKLLNMDHCGDSSTAVLSNHIQDVRIQDLWELDLIGIREPMIEKTRQELTDAAVTHFRKTVTRKIDGRYIVNLPWIEGHPPLPSYRYIAEKKLVGRKMGLLRESHQDLDTTSVIMESLNQKVLQLQLRPVFNASFKTKGNPSLNDCLEVGPNLLEEIPNILTRFRLGHVGVISDIKKAFLQIEVAEQDRDFLRFLWYQDKNYADIQDFRHCRVVFGVSSSPFLLGAVLNYHLEQCTDEQKSTALLLKKCFYVDNCVISLPSYEEAFQFQQQAVQLLSTAQMDLRGWEIGPSTENKDVPVLGLTWNLQLDNLSCDLRGIHKKMETGTTTKRKILSVAHSLFDPVGFTCPISIIPKMLLQETCKLKLGWDDPLPEELDKKFTKWCCEVDQVSDLKVPRCIAKNQDRSTWSLIVFTDASSTAYGVCIYLRSGYPEKIEVNLLMARSRVAPMKCTTIPRLELVGCLCGVRLAAKVIQMLDMPDIPVYYLTDSTTALAWILNEESWSVFIAARVNEIRQTCKVENWRHVPGKENPADIPSRGCSIKYLLQSSWWKGPAWLKLDDKLWPRSQELPNCELVLSEKRKTVVSHLNVVENFILSVLNRRSDYHKIVRIMAYVIRFIRACQKVGVGNTTDNEPLKISLEEMLNTGNEVTKLIQQQHFIGLQDPKLRKLQVGLDGKGIIRLKTRLFVAEKDFHTCPAVLPSKDALVTKIIQKTHLLACHAGVQTLMVILREKFWILNCRRTVRSVIRSCVKCARFRSQPMAAPEGPLPDDRVRVDSAFSVAGVDMAGPLYTKGKKKVWIVIFTCATYRAIHLELCTSLSTEHFILAFRRFVARRGRPNTIYSDNGLNFVGCSNLIKKLDWSKVTKFADVQEIRWKFNPPTASWWGGFWERLIGIVKQLLRSVLGSARVTNEELQTLLCDVESVVNSRPLTYVSEDGEDLKPLTPNHFIRNCGTSVLPDVDAIERDLLNTRYRNMQHCMDELRSRFRKEYLAMLVHQGKQKKNVTVTVGDVVLVGSDQQKRIDWPMGVVTETMPGRDGHVRVVRVKTATGVFLRPLQRLYLLEVRGNEI